MKSDLVRSVTLGQYIYCSLRAVPIKGWHGHHWWPSTLLFKSLLLLSLCHLCPCHFSFLAGLSLLALPIWIVIHIYCPLGFLISISLNASPQNVFLAVYCLEGKADREGKGVVLIEILTTDRLGWHFLSPCTVGAKQHKESK